MARPQKKQSLHPAELEFFDAFLERLKGPIRSFEALDGLFCALICAPRAVLPAQYIDLIMGSGGAFENEAQAHKVTDLMIRHFNSIVDQLQSTYRTDDIYVPALIIDENGTPDGREWASGFKLTAEQDPDTAQHSPDLAPENREDLLEDMFVGLSDIYAHFAAERRAS
jgi:uncharacterized protein